MVVNRLIFTLALVMAASLAVGVSADEAEDVLVEKGIVAFHNGNYTEAKTILLPLAEAGHPKAMNIIGMLHQDTPVFPNDPKIKCDWYERAAMAGYSSGMYNLGNCYYLGNGRAIDHTTAWAWFRKSAESGDIDIMLRLANIDETSPENRRFWLKKAAEHGSKFAAAGLWIDGHREDAPNFTLLDELCVMVRILYLDQDWTSCDD